MPTDDETGVKPTNPVETTDNKPAGETPDTGDSGEGKFDLDRAMKTIQKLRDEVKAAKMAAKDADAAREREKLTETEKLKADLAAANAKLKEVEKTAQERALKADVLLAASKHGFNDPEDAWRFIDRDSLDDSDAIKDALADLAKSKPYLVKGEGSNQPPAAPDKPKPKMGNPGREEGLTLDAIRGMTPEQIAENMDKVHAALSRKK